MQRPSIPFWTSSGFTMALLPLLAGLYWLTVWVVQVVIGDAPFDAAALWELLKGLVTAGIGYAGLRWRWRKGLDPESPSPRIRLGREPQEGER